MTVRSLFASALLCAVATAASAGQPVWAQEAGSKASPGAAAPSQPPEHGPGASGKGDGSGMGQDTSEIGTPKGPGDKGGPPPDKSVAPVICDDGRQPVGGACPG